MKTTLKFNEKAQIWKNSTGTVTLDSKKLSAFSYNWWQFVRKHKGEVYFNNYRYSVTTQAHQRAVMLKLRELGVSPIIVTVAEGLQDVDSKGMSKLSSLYRGCFA